MKLQYLGTAAAEGVPAPFCACETCQRSRKLGGRSIRSRSQAIVDDTLLIDLPCDTFYHATLYGVDMTAVRHCLITHTHRDHLYPEEIKNFYKGNAHLPDDAPPFTFYGSEDVWASIRTVVERSGDRVRFRELKPFEDVPINGYTVTPLKAAHGTAHPYIYLIAHKKTAMLYVHDSDDLPDETWEHLRRRPHLSFVSLDCTEGAHEKMPYRGAHMSLGVNRTFRDKLRRAGLIERDTPVCLNHFSHNGKDVVYEDFRRIAGRDGFLVSYDGMTIAF